MSQIPTTVTITDDPLGHQARSEHAHLLQNASVTQTQPIAAPVPIPPPPAASTKAGKAQPAPAPAPVLPPPPRAGHVPGNVRIHHDQQMILHGGSGVEVPSNNGSTRVVIHRALVTEEVAPGVHIHKGYAEAPGETQVALERPQLESSHARIQKSGRKRPPKKTKAKAAKASKKAKKAKPAKP